MSSGAPAGWYPDPDIIGHHRWWTGEGWSAVVIASNRVPANNQAPPGADVLPDRQPSRPPAWGGDGTSGYVAPTIGNGGYTPPVVDLGATPAEDSAAGGGDMPALPMFMPAGGAAAADEGSEGESVPELPMFMPPGSNGNFTATTAPGATEAPPDSAFGTSVDPFGNPAASPAPAPAPTAAPTPPASPMPAPLGPPAPAGGPIAAPPPAAGRIAAPPPAGAPLRAPAPPPNAATRLAGPSGPPPAMRMAPGWYADPLIPGQFRYWDGTNWTNAVSGG